MKFHNMTPAQFQEALRIVNCLSFKDLKKIFPHDTDHYAKKLESKGVFTFICYLDNENIKSLFDFIADKLQGQIWE